LEATLKDILGLVEAVETLAYKILFWIIAVPKTLWRIIMDPDWVPGYINRELKRDQSAFDEYISPIILLLVVTLIPTLIIFVLPDFSLSISSPAEIEPSTQRQVEFEAEATFKSGSTNMRDTYTWYVELLETDEAGEFIYDQYGYATYRKIYQEVYSELTDSTTITFEDDPEQTFVIPHQQNTYLTRDGMSSFDKFIYTFNAPGSYFVNVEVERADINRSDVPVEGYGYEYGYEYTEGYGGAIYMYVIVPADPTEPVSITNFAARSEPMEAGELFSERIIMVIALILLVPPLLFAFAIRVITRERVSENSLKENFYVQCYFFAPFSLTAWATFYGSAFYTIDIFSFNNIYLYTLYLPLIWAGLWFISAQTHALAAALRIPVWKAFIMILLCAAIMSGLVYLVLHLVFYDQSDILRKGLIWAYPLVFHLALLGLILIRFFTWVAGLHRISVGDVILVLLFLPSSFFFVGGSMLGRFAVPGAAALSESDPAVEFLPVLDTPIPFTPTATSAPPTESSLPILVPVTGGKPTSHVMHRGEFPYCLARRFDVHPAELLALNNLSDGYRIGVGSTVLIPQSGSPFPGSRALRNHPATYVVLAPDETLYSVACLYGDVDPNAIATANGIPTDAALYTGQPLQIP
jgi:hypothetical protein